MTLWIIDHMADGGYPIKLSTTSSQVQTMDGQPCAADGDAPAYIHHGTREFKHANLALFSAGFATFGLLYCVQPLMPEFTHDFHVSAAASAMSLSLTTGILAFSMLFAGAVSDAFGRKSVMAASLLSSALLVLLTAFSTDWHMLLLLRGLLGLSLSGLPAVAMTYLSEEVHENSLGLGMGLYISGNALGGMGGRLIAGVLADFFGWRVGIGVVGVVGAVAGGIFLYTLPPSRHFSRLPLRLRPLLARMGYLFRDAGLRWLWLEGFLLLGSFVTVYNYVGYRLLGPPYGLSQAVVGLIFSVYLVGSFSSAWMGQLAGRLGRGRVLWTNFVLMLVGILLTLAQSLPLIVLGIVAITFGFFGGHSIVSSWVGQRGGAAKAQAASLYLFAYYMGSSIAGAGGGLFYAVSGWGGVAGFVGAMLILGLAAALRLSRLKPPAVRVAKAQAVA